MHITLTARLTVQEHMQQAHVNSQYPLSAEEKIKLTATKGVEAERWLYEYLQQHGLETETTFAIYSFHTPWLRAYIEHKPSNKHYCVSTILKDTTTTKPHEQNWQLTATDIDTHSDNYQDNEKFSKVQKLMDIVETLTHLIIVPDKLMRDAEEMLNEKGIEVISTRMGHRTGDHENFFLELRTVHTFIVYNSSYGPNGNWRLAGQVQRRSLKETVKEMIEQKKLMDKM